MSVSDEVGKDGGWVQHEVGREIGWRPEEKNESEVIVGKLGRCLGLGWRSFLIRLLAPLLKVSGTVNRFSAIRE